jgi:hypothetical protein
LVKELPDFKKKIVFLSMAWPQEDSTSLKALDPDINAITQWYCQLSVGKGETIFAIANQSGEVGDFTYAGTSAILKVKPNNKVLCYDLLGWAETALLVINTDIGPNFKFVCTPNAPTTSTPPQVLLSLGRSAIPDPDIIITPIQGPLPQATEKITTVFMSPAVLTANDNTTAELCPLPTSNGKKRPASAYF